MTKLYTARIIADSVSPCGKRLTTMVVRIPKFVQAELNTHRMFSRNSASSRAIPIAKMIERIEKEPAMPVFWGKNQPGMQAREEIDESDKNHAQGQWWAARQSAIAHAKNLIDLGVHKQIANRLLEPWMITEVVVSATEWKNFFNQRCHPDAQPELRQAAESMREAMEANTPVKSVKWHLPFIDLDFDYAAIYRETGRGLEDIVNDLTLISAARCARVSYLTHEGRRDWKEDLVLASRLMSSGHWSPFEHVAYALPVLERVANFVGWKQLRVSLDKENFQ